MGADGTAKQAKLTQAQMEALLRQSFQSDSAGVAGQVIVKKANIIADPTAATVKGGAANTAAPKTATVKQGRATQDHTLRVSLVAPALNAAQVTASQQARFKSGPTSQTRSKHQVDAQSSREMLQQSETLQKAEALKKAKQPVVTAGTAATGPNAAITFSFVKKPANPGAKAGADGRVAPARKAKTSYARTPASFRSTSGGKPSTQGGVQMVVPAHPDNQGGGISVTHANSPEVMNYKTMGGAKQQSLAQRMNPPAGESGLHPQLQVQSQQAKTAKVSTKARQAQQHRDQKLFQQAMAASKQPAQLPYTNAQSFGSLTNKQSKQAKYSSKTLAKGAVAPSEPPNASKAGKAGGKNAQGGQHKRSVSFKSNQEAISLIQNTHVTQNQSSPLQGPGQ